MKGGIDLTADEAERALAIARAALRETVPQFDPTSVRVRLDDDGLWHLERRSSVPWYEGRRALTLALAAFRPDRLIRCSAHYHPDTIDVPMPACRRLTARDAAAGKTCQS